MLNSLNRTDHLITKGYYTGLLLTGDFNFSSTEWDEYGYPYSSKKNELNFTETVRNLSLFQHLNFPTFLMPQSEVRSILDLIFTEKAGRIENLANPLGDLRRCHISPSFDFVLNSPWYLMRHSAKLNFKNANLETISRHFDSIDWNDTLGPLDLDLEFGVFIFDR